MQHSEVVNSICSILNEHDPMGIITGHEEDDYQQEAGKIADQLYLCESKADVNMLTRSVLVYHFTILHANKHISSIVNDIWELLRDTIRPPATSFQPSADKNATQASIMPAFTDPFASP